LPINSKESLQHYFAQGAEFHGYLSPGLVLGILMVDLAKEILGPRSLIDAVVETKACLPDAIQLMTACTYGNSWMRVKNWDKMALTLYDKKTLDGVRIFLNLDKIKQYPLIYQWYIRIGEVDKETVAKEIMHAGRDIISWQRVRTKLPKKAKRAHVAICPLCGEGYSASDGELCLRCGGSDDYYEAAGKDADK